MNVQRLGRALGGVIGSALVLLAAGCASRVESIDPGGVPANDADETRLVPPCSAPLVPDAAPGTVAALAALVEGRWARCAGEPQVEGEEVGVELTDGRLLIPLRRAEEGAIERVPPDPALGPESWSALLDTEGHPRLLFLWPASHTTSSLVIEAPRFFDGGARMFFPYTPAGATYARLSP